ncbi:DUF222 domain-containing protein [Cellulomonas sp. APG4]|uniref:HNH endonuclease signature motif containing protein n=1 Tax=Cellulomonas sp. APG4 TaxID=1538656 RepID=UPI00137AA157|nr:HNH endonuclease signature motif containing protein [Cellulomonas sp. APG4]NCT89410.1 DUF222 domain-containing protein [Cellulomonas sp. APG4]
MSFLHESPAEQPLGGRKRGHASVPSSRGLAVVLEDAAPGAELAALLGAVEVADVDDAALVEVVAGWERVASWATAGQAAAIAELGRRAVGGTQEFVADEVAARLRLSSRAAQNLVRRAEGLATMPAVHDLLASGDLDARRVDVLVRETDHLSAQDARAVSGAVLERAPEQTGPQLRVALRRADVLRDPGTAHVRHARARAERCVRMTPAPDAMAWVTAFLPATDAAAVMSGLDALAAAAAPADERSLAARRADALTDVLRRVLDTGVGPDGPVPTSQHRRPHVHLTLSAGGLGAEAGGVALDPVGVAELAGYGPIPLPVAQEVAAEATWRAVGVDPRTGEALTRSSRAYRPSPRLATAVVDRDVTCTFPGCRIPAERCDIDHVTPYDATGDAAAQTREDNLIALCRHHHRLKTHAGWTPTRDPATGAVRWRTPHGTTYTRDPVPADPEWEPPPRRRPLRPVVDPRVADSSPPGAFEQYLRARAGAPSGDREERLGAVGSAQGERTSGAAERSSGVGERSSGAAERSSGVGERSSGAGGASVGVRSASRGAGEASGRRCAPAEADDPPF